MAEEIKLTQDEADELKQILDKNIEVHEQN